jgi:hypothetical protein
MKGNIIIKISKIWSYTCKDITQYLNKKFSASSKRKAEALPNPRSNKRSKNAENEGFMAVPFEIPEVFALIGSFLVQKLANLVNLSRVNSR